MNKLINKAAATFSGLVLFAATLVMAGLGFAVIATLAVFAFVALGVAFLVAPFLGLAQKAAVEADPSGAQVPA